jgi:pimeloyl-ACP methyl ester carboxylesterase
MRLGMHTLALLPDEGRALLRALARVGALGPLAFPLFAARPHATVVAALAEEVRPRAFVDAAHAAAAYDVDAWRRIRCPVRSVRGARDVFAGADDGVALGDLIPDFAESVLRDAGHFAAVERPDDVLRLLAPVLARSAASTS